MFDTYFFEQETCMISSSRLFHSFFCRRYTNVLFEKGRRLSLGYEWFPKLDRLKHVFLL